MNTMNIQKRWNLLAIVAAFGLILCSRNTQAGYIDCGDGTVSDTGTGLMWQQATASSPCNWYNAVLYCENLILAEHSDWRLPEINELQGLLDTNYSPRIDTSFFPDTKTDNAYWSHTQEGSDSGYAWTFDYGNNPGAEGASKNSTWYYVRAVRNGQCVTSILSTSTSTVPATTSTVESTSTSTVPATTSTVESTSTSIIATTAPTTSSTTIEFTTSVVSTTTSILTTSSIQSTSTTTSLVPTCTVKLFPDSISKLVSLLKPIKFFIIFGENGTEFTSETVVEWNTEGIENINKFVMREYKSFMIVKVLIKPQYLEAKELYKVQVGDCFGSLKIGVF